MISFYIATHSLQYEVPSLEEMLDANNSYAGSHSQQQGGVMGNVKVKSSLGYSNHEIVQYCIHRAARGKHSKFATLEWGEQTLPSTGICLVD